MEQTQQWQGPERRQSLGPYQGADRRRAAGGYQSGQGTPGVNAEEPKTEQDEHDLQQRDGPNPR